MRTAPPEPARDPESGFASGRDLVSFLRYERIDRNGTPSPMIAGGMPTNDTGMRRALAFGVPQSGRFLRHFLELGMNDDGHGPRVFDGVMSHVAGAGKVFANHRFGMPGRTATQHEDRLYPEKWFPFGNAVTTDPFSRQTGAILQGHATDPLVIETNSSTEYWQKGASLVHTDPTGRHDADLPPNVRVFIAFARAKTEREAAGDPRSSLVERYGSREAYVAKIKAAAEALVAERLLLPADAAAYVKAAEECDRF